MIRKKTMAIVTMLTLAILQAGFAQQKPASTSTSLSLTLEAAVSRAMVNQPLILKAEAAVAAARAGVGESQSSYFPNLSGSASYTRLGPEQSITFPGLGSFSLYQVDNYGFQIGLNQLIFASGARGLQVKLAQTGVEAAAIGVEQVKMNIAYHTVQTFYTALFLEQEEKALDDQLYDLNQHLAAVQKKADTGSATKYDVLSTEVRVASMQSLRINADNQYQKALIALQQLLGLDPSTLPAPSGDFTAGTAIGNSEELIAQAFENRAEIKQAAQAESSAELARQLAGVGGLPTVSAHAAFGFKNGLLPDTNSLTANWSAGVQLNVPIFNGLLNARKIDEAVARMDAAKQAAAAATRDIVTQVREAIEDVSASRKQAEASLVQLNHAQEMLSVAKVQFDIGVITNIEYLDAQTTLAQAKLDQLRDVYHEMMSQYALKQALGQQIWNGSATPSTK